MEVLMNKTFCVRPKNIDPFVLKPFEIPERPVIKPLVKMEPSVSHHYPTRPVVGAIPRRQAPRSDVNVYHEYKMRSGEDEILKIMRGYVSGFPCDSKGKIEISPSRERTLRTLAKFALCLENTPMRVEDCPSGRCAEHKPKRESKAQKKVNHSVTLNSSLTPVVCDDRKGTVEGASEVDTPPCKLTSSDGAHSLTVTPQKTKICLPDISTLNDKAKRLVQHQTYRQQLSSIIEIYDLLDDECSSTSLPEQKPIPKKPPHKKAGNIVKHQPYKQQLSSIIVIDDLLDNECSSTLLPEQKPTPIKPPCKKAWNIVKHQPYKQQLSSIIKTDDLLDNECSTTSLPEQKPTPIKPFRKKAQNIVKHQPYKQQLSSIIEIDDLLDNECSTTSLPEQKPTPKKPAPKKPPRKKAQNIAKHQPYKQTLIPSVKDEDRSSDECPMTMPFSSNSSSDKAANFALTVSDRTEELQRESSKQSTITKLFVKARKHLTRKVVEESKKEGKMGTKSFTLEESEKTKKPNQTRKKKKKEEKPAEDSFPQTEDEKTEEPNGPSKKKQPLEDSFTSTEKRSGIGKKMKWWKSLLRLFPTRH